MTATFTVSSVVGLLVDTVASNTLDIGIINTESDKINTGFETISIAMTTSDEVIGMNVMGNIFSGNFQGAADASAAGNSAMGDLILTTAITFADNMETGYELMASGIGKIGVAIDGSDGLVESLSGAAPKEAIDLLSNVISDPFTEEGEATKAMAGIAIAFDAGATQFGKISDSLTTTKDGIVSGGNSILTAFSSVATAIANADLLGMIIDAVLERIVPTPKTVNKIGEGGGSGDYGGGHAGGGAGARGGVMTLLSVGGTSTLIER